MGRERRGRAGIGRLLSLTLILGWAACGEVEHGRGELRVASVQDRSRPRRDPELAEVRSALEAGRGDLALTLLERVEGFEPECLRARAALLEGDAVEALRRLEIARGLAPDHPELWATEAEILASLDRLEAAAKALEEGRKRAGDDPALERALGVIQLRNQGHAREALQALERARARDPELPFLRWPLSEAHRLVGRSLCSEAPGEALAHARAACALEPGSLEALELEAEALAANLQFEEALVRYGELAARGRDYGETPALLHQRCATRLLLEHERAGAVEHYLQARALGLDDEGLGFGSAVLLEEARLARERGSADIEAEDWAAAEREFARAMELDPRDFVAENHLAVARFQRGDYRAAAEGWERVLVRASAEELLLPDPVALNLARAWRLAGERERARGALAGYLDREPEGEWSASARELLEVLEAEELAGKPPAPR